MSPEPRSLQKTQSNSSLCKAEFVVASNSFAHAVASEVESQLEDLLVCLGQEEQKVEILSAALRLLGYDSSRLLMHRGLDDVSLTQGLIEETPEQRDSDNFFEGSAFTPRSMLTDSNMLAHLLDQVRVPEHDQVKVLQNGSIPSSVCSTPLQRESSPADHLKSQMLADVSPPTKVNELLESVETKPLIASNSCFPQSEGDSNSKGEFQQKSPDDPCDKTIICKEFKSFDCHKLDDSKDTYDNRGNFQKKSHAQRALDLSSFPLLTPRLMHEDYMETPRQSQAEAGLKSGKEKQKAMDVSEQKMVPQPPAGTINRPVFAYFGWFLFVLSKVPPEMLGKHSPST